MHNITLINMRDGSISGHKAGCRDIKGSRRDWADEPWTFEVSSKREASAAYNADFDEEIDGWHPINWAPCTSHVPNDDNPTDPTNTRNNDTVQEDTMSTTTTTTTTTTEFLLSAAKDAYSTLRRESGQRASAVVEFLSAETDEARDNAIWDTSAGYMRRGLREAAVYFAGKDDEETANVFWALRDMVGENGFDDGDEVADEAV